MRELCLAETMVDFIVFLEDVEVNLRFLNWHQEVSCFLPSSHCGMVQVEFVDEVMQIPVTKQVDNSRGKSGARPWDLGMQMALLCKYQRLYIYIYIVNIIAHHHRVHVIFCNCDFTDLFLNLVGISIPGSRGSWTSRDVTCHFSLSSTFTRWNCDSISQVNVPMVSKVEKVVEIPQVQYIDKVVDIPVQKQARRQLQVLSLDHGGAPPLFWLTKPSWLGTGECSYDYTSGEDCWNSSSRAPWINSWRLAV